MNSKTIHKIIGASVFLIALIVLFKTVQVSVSFWDCGELSAASAGLEVTHPPGAPFFILMNHILTLIPFAQNIGFRVNTLTVIVSSFSVLFLYLVAVRLIKHSRAKANQSITDDIITYISAAIGALSMCFATAYWFNSTESNVFGFSTFLFTLMMWLMMVWYEKADEKGSDKYILLIAFILGLSPGVHLMSVLAAVPVGMIYVYRKFVRDEEFTKQTAKLFVGHAAVLFVIALFMWASQNSSTPPSPEEYRDFDNKFKLVMIVVSIVIIGIFWKKVFNRNSFYLPFLVGLIASFVIYPGIVKILPNLIETITGNHLFTGTIIVLILLVVLLYIGVWSHNNKRPVVNVITLSLFLAIVGFSTYAYIIIRADKHPSINENDPQDFKTLVSYLSREQYGEFPVFKRRYSSEPQHQPVWANYKSDLDYFWRWQMNHMYNRFLFWEYIGRESWEQDAGVKFNQLYGIPFLIGLIGLFAHFRRDWKLASIFLATFIFMGYLIAFYQNQQNAQPRDREYFYSGSWFVFSAWIAIGCRSIVDDIQRFIKKTSAARGVSFAFLFLAFLFIPVNMFRTNYHQEDRSHNWVPWDYAYNLLQSCEPNAILFTCGDNDTFPLWYMQEAEGIRTDVRIANLSLINTDWYILALKNDTPHGSMKVAMNLSDDQITRLQPVQWEAKNIDIPVPKNVFDQFGVTDTSLVNKGKITFRMNSTLSYGNVKAIRVQDIMVREIVLANKWQRPIYFASTCGEDSRIGLDEYMRLEGIADHLVPYRTSNIQNVNPELTGKDLLGPDAVPSKTYQRGFIIRGFNTNDIFLDENQLRITFGYRNSYMALATYYLNVLNDKTNCIKALDVMDQKLPRSLVEMDWRLEFNLANIYYSAGDMAKYEEVAKDVKEEAQKRIIENPNNIQGYYNPYIILKTLYEYSGEYDKEIEILQRIQTIAGGSAADVQGEIQRVTKLRDSLQAKNKK